MIVFFVVSLGFVLCVFLVWVVPFTWIFANIPYYYQPGI